MRLPAPPACDIITNIRWHKVDCSTVPRSRRQTDRNDVAKVPSSMVMMMKMKLMTTMLSCKNEMNEPECCVCVTSVSTPFLCVCVVQWLWLCVRALGV